MIKIPCLPLVLERIVAEYAWESYLSDTWKQKHDSCVEQLRSIGDRFHFHSTWQQPRNIMMLTAAVILNPTLPGRTVWIHGKGVAVCCESADHNDNQMIQWLEDSFRQRQFLSYWTKLHHAKVSKERLRKLSSWMRGSDVRYVMFAKFPPPKQLTDVHKIKTIHWRYFNG